MSWRKSWAKVNIYGKNGDGTCSKRKLLPDERSVWDDYLDLASTSVLRGKVCLASDTGYTLEQLSKLLNTSQEILSRAETQMIEFKMVTIDEYRVITIKNWRKYQSEYDRQKPYRLQQKVTSESYGTDIDIDIDNTRPTVIRHHFCNKFKDKVGSDYLWAYGKDGALLKNVLRILKNEEIITLVDAFFVTNDPFPKTAGYTFGVFYSMINKLRIPKPVERGDAWKQ